MDDVKCTKCGRIFPWISEEAITIETLNGCLDCTKGNLTDRMMEGIAEELKIRKETAKDLPVSVGSAETSQLAIYRDHRLLGIKALLIAVVVESEKQLGKWGIQSRTAFEWMSYLTEEIGELAQAINDHEYCGDPKPDTLKRNIYQEAIQVATLALKIAEMFGQKDLARIREENQDLIDPEGDLPKCSECNCDLPIGYPYNLCDDCYVGVE
jgi:NTP pyrophosphatase (non-canonical NTP hydrolase)